MRLDSKICLLGLRDDVERIRQSFDIFILPSFYEGFPVVVSGSTVKWFASSVFGFNCKKR